MDIFTEDREDIGPKDIDREAISREDVGGEDTCGEDIGREDVGRIIKLLSDRMRAAADLDLRSRGLTFPQSTVLFYLSEHGGEASQKEIERYLDVSHPTVVGLVARLERSGFVVSRSAVLDRRHKIISATPKAVQLSAELQEFIEQRETLLLSGLSAEEVSELRLMLLVMLQNLAGETIRKAKN